MYKGTLSGVLFALIARKIPSVNCFNTSAATDAREKYEVCQRYDELVFFPADGDR